MISDLGFIVQEDAPKSVEISNNQDYREDVTNPIENEIGKISHISTNKEIAKESISIAENFDLAYTQLKIVNKLESLLN